ncbi:hypothetical protein NDU88_001531 [Pleurodeles waltl]|uniref:Uncharacterized protein n=1 Tax=Pleurodeles waltl TaxID=8319 RepID=A0AAV7U737_PLEWA|nr:hypothetical protein NDU88_001531 [Pleurodeles waltl]
MYGILDSHSTRLDAAEQRIFDVEDSGTALAKHMERVERLLKTVAEKNLDLEARSLWNNSRITVMAATTNTSSIDTCIEELLINLFGRDSFTNLCGGEEALVSWHPSHTRGASSLVFACLLNFRIRDASIQMLSYCYKKMACGMACFIQCTFE